MNTFHPFSDDDQDLPYNEYADERILNDNYGVEINNGLEDSQFDSKLLPPDEPLSEFELWNDPQPEDNPGYEQKPKSRGRYDMPQETGDFKERHKQWDPKVSKLTSSKESNDTYGLKQKDRQFRDRSPNYIEGNDQDYFPDVSQINEEELINPDSNSQELQYQQIQPEITSESEEFLDFHHNFFSNLKRMGIDVTNMDGIKEIEHQLRSIMTQGNQNQDPSIMISQVKGLLQKVTSSLDTNTSKNVPQMPTDNFQLNQEDQNLHPNISSYIKNEDSKLDNSGIQHSAISNRKFQGRIPDPHTPESVGRRYNESHTHVTPRDKAQMHDPYQNPSPNQHPNAYPNDELDEQKNEELNLNLADRLPHKKWQIRKNAYTEIADMFQGKANGDTFAFLGPNDEEIEYNPLTKYEEWIIRIIRDTNLIAQYEGLNTLLVFLHCSPEVKNTTMSTLPDLLDKVNHKKNNFKDITVKIIETMFERDMGHHILPELLKRFKTARNKDITEFVIQILELIITKDKYLETINLKHVFNGIANSLVNHNNKIRDAGLQLLKEVYVRVDDN
jgi:hypothetical protein